LLFPVNPKTDTKKMRSVAVLWLDDDENCTGTDQGADSSHAVKALLPRLLIGVSFRAQSKRPRYGQQKILG
jgi:hypothetical protein